MRKVKLFIASSLDGYIARKSGAIDWLPTDTDRDYGYGEFYATVDTVLMGRKTYEQVLSFGGDYPYSGKRNIVFSTTLENANPAIEVVRSDLVTFVNHLRHSEGQDIWLVGGSELIQLFLKHRWIDELILFIQPIVLGDGIPLIATDTTLETSLTLKSVCSFDTGAVRLSYEL